MILKPPKQSWLRFGCQTGFNCELDLTFTQKKNKKIWLFSGKIYPTGRTPALFDPPLKRCLKLSENSCNF